MNGLVFSGKQRQIGEILVAAGWKGELLMELTGETDKDERDKIKAAFQADPATDRVFYRRIRTLHRKKGPQKREQSTRLIIFIIVPLARSWPRNFM